MLILNSTLNIGPKSARVQDIWQWHELMEVDLRCRGIFSVAEINSALAAAQQQRVGWLSFLIYNYQLSTPLLHLDISHPPSASSSNSCDLLFVSSRHTEGLWGSCCCSALLSMPVFLTLSALFLLGFSGHLLSRACHFPGSVSHLCYRIRAQSREMVD